MSLPRLAPGRWAPAVRAGLERMIAEHGRYGARFDPDLPPLAVFDFDDTCLDGDISHALLDDLDLLEPGLVEEYRAACAVDLRRAYVDLVGTLVGGRTEAEVRDATHRALERGLGDGRLALVDEMRDLVGQLHDHGWQAWVVTASPAPVVRAIATHYRFEEDQVIGMRSARGADGRFSREVLEPITYREGKLAALRGATRRDPTFAAGDSASDRFLLSNAVHALLIDRGDAALRSEAETSGWWIQERWR